MRGDRELEAWMKIGADSSSEGWISNHVKSVEGWNGSGKAIFHIVALHFLPRGHVITNQYMVTLDRL